MSKMNYGTLANKFISYFEGNGQIFKPFYFKNYSNKIIIKQSRSN